MGMRRITYLGKGMEAEWDGNNLTINKPDGHQTILDERQFRRCSDLIRDGIDPVRNEDEEL